MTKWKYARNELKGFLGVVGVCFVLGFFFFELQVKEHRKKINIIVFYAPIDQ